MRKLSAPTALIGVALVAALAFATVAAGGRVDIRRSGTLTVALASEPDALDPTLARTLVGRTIFVNMCEKLYDLDARLNIVPQLAAALPTVSPDKRTVTIRLRRGIRFNDGTVFNANAVKISLDRHRTLPRSARASELSPVASVDVVDASTVRLNLSSPFAPLTAQLADRAGMIMSPSRLNELGDKFATNPACVGPFTFAERVAGDRIVLKRSEHYYGKANVKLDTLVFRIITDPSARAANLRSRDVDVIEGIASSDLPAIARDPNLRVMKATSIGYQGLTINIGNKNGVRKPFENLGTPLASRQFVRQAFDLALDRRVINKVVFGGTVLPGCGPIAPTSPWYTPQRCPTRNVALARKLIAATGVATPIKIRLMLGTDPVAARLGQVIQSMTREVGFDVALEPTEFVTSLNRGDAGNFEMWAIGWSGRVDPDGNIYQFVHTKGSLNNAGYSNPRLDLILDNARKATKPAARKRLYAAAVKLIRAQHPLIYLYHPVIRTGVVKNVRGVRVFSDGLIRAYGASFAS